MNRHLLRQHTRLMTAVAGVGTLILCGGLANALSTTYTYGSQVSTAVQTVINRGDQEIARRLATLNSLTDKINSTAKLSASDKSTLTTEVNTEISNLTTLQTQLDGETTLAAAHTDAQSIVTSYRVYALIVPKVNLIKTADGQQIVEGKLGDLAGKLQTRLQSAQNAGKNVTSLETTLNDMKTQTQNALNISTGVETKVLPLKPTDYNSDHSLLSGYRTQLQTAHADNVAAYNDAKVIVSGLKSL